MFTAGEINTSLARLDGMPVNRREYFLIESPDAYRFELLIQNFASESAYTTPLHMLPAGTNVKFYYDFKDYTKVMYPHDLSIVETLISERERHLKFEAHADDAILALLAKLRKMNRQGTRLWEKKIDSDIERLFIKWDIYEFAVNRDAYTGLVLECKSRRFGDVVLKVYPSFLAQRYVKESFIMSTLRDYPQAPLLAVDEKRNAMLLGRVIPGDYIVYEEDQEDIAEMFGIMQKNRMSVANAQNIPLEIKGIVEQTEDEYKIASRYDFYPDVMRYLLEKTREVYNECFANEDKYILHGDAYYKNALRSSGGIQVIDPVGYVDAFVFEYMPLLTYELALHTKPEDYVTRYKSMKAYFSKLVDTKKFNAATFVFLVKQLIPSIYEANDEFKRASRYLRLIKSLFFDEHDGLNIDKCEN